jgi:hypothetical protein
MVNSRLLFTLRVLAAGWFFSYLNLFWNSIVFHLRVRIITLDEEEETRGNSDLVYQPCPLGLRVEPLCQSLADAGADSFYAILRIRPAVQQPERAFAEVFSPISPPRLSLIVRSGI